MPPDETDDVTERLRRSWIANAAAWSDAVRERRIESRRVATDEAVVQAVLDQHPQTVLDLGCGEGWLARALSAHGIAVTGVDASPALIAAARELGGGEFHVAAYADFVHRPHDVTVANFSLLEEDLAPLLRDLSSPTLIVQTVHPSNFGDEDGWRVETFASMPGEWPEPMPWYFRTRASWERLFAETGWAVREVREPRGLSLLFVCRPSHLAC